MKHIHLRNLLFIFVISMVIWFVVQIFSPLHFFSPDSATVRMPDNIDLQLQKVQYTKSRAGKSLWTLEADSADHMENGLILLKTVFIVLFDEKDGKTQITADHGRFKTGEDTMTVDSNVVVVSSSGQTLKTDFLQYEQSSNLLQTDSYVQISTDEYVITGKGMRIDVTERTMEILDDVKAQYKVIGNKGE